MFSKTFFFALIPSILAASFSVSVGSKNGLTFDPTSVVADIGDTIIFTVLSRNHSITSADFSGAVCPPPAGGAGLNPFDSGYLSDLDGSLPTFTYTVPSTEPQFAACMQAGGAHCRAGMTFAINPNSTLTYAQFNTNAANS
ncbi:hypothetical protein DFH08DRAFT_975296 [Mycena albidolilacea]|uniref:Uncharacterized protein n=1 Tax=Mycena albidolilacea TaxID=1033008 RepID=A0AAD6Z5J9_9AGAR|nr:hypothetical protein DFH08DRAFT_975296 [Mycena albidolilacea]